MILCDLPYGTTACKWDTPLPLDKLWLEYKRIIKSNGAIVLTASQPFTSKLVSSNYEMFKYSWVWNKKKSGNIFLGETQPMKIHEDILIFGIKTPNYNPIMVKRDNIKISKNYGTGNAFGGDKTPEDTIYTYTHKYPISIIEKSNAYQTGKVHPTQKPVALFEYLIKTYTNENDLILDNCAGSGTTGVASQNLNRNCIMIEQEPEYCNIIRERMATHETLIMEARKQQTLQQYQGQQTLTQTP